MHVVAAVVRGDASYHEVLRTAAELAVDESFRVLSLHVGADSDPQVFRTPAQRSERERAVMKQQIEDDLERLSLDATVTVPCPRLSNLGDEIVRRAREADARVIVIGTQGRTGLSRLFVGSVAERVVRHAHCDVLVARPRPG